MEAMVKLIIAGSRIFDESVIVVDICVKAMLGHRIIDNPNAYITEVVSGTAWGADTAGERWADWRGIPVKQFRPDWKKWKTMAGIVRNREMADYADGAIVIWDGKSRGSKNMIEEMQKRQKPVFVFNFDGNEILLDKLVCNVIE